MLYIIIMFSEVVKLYCMICRSSGSSLTLVVMEARTAALVTIFRKKERQTSEVFCNTFR